MAWVEKRGKTWSVRYRSIDAAGNETKERVSGFKTKEDAWEAAKQLERSSDSGIDVNGDRRTIGYWVERWFADHVLIAAERTTAARYNQGISVLTNLPIWNEPVRNLTPLRYTQLLRFLLEREPGKCIAAATATNYADPIRLALSWAVRQGFIPRNPIIGYSALSIPRRQHRILSDQDIEDLTRIAEGRSIRLALLLGLYGGLRPEEIAGLSWDQVDMTHRSVRITEVRTRMNTGEEITKRPKTEGSSRTITLPDVVLQALKDAPRPHRLVCVTPEGTPYTLDAMRRAVTRLSQYINAERAKTKRTAPMPLITLRDLRHSHAALLIRLGVHPKVIAERLGHTSIKVTMDTYGYLMSGMQYTAVDAIDKHIEQVNRNPIDIQQAKKGRKGA